MSFGINIFHCPCCRCWQSSFPSNKSTRAVKLLKEVKPIKAHAALNIVKKNICLTIWFQTFIFLCAICVFQSNGAEANRPMGIPGEHLSGVFAAKDFVGWYNGIPTNKEVVLFVNHSGLIVRNVCLIFFAFHLCAVMPWSELWDGRDFGTGKRGPGRGPDSSVSSGHVKGLWECFY